MDKRDLEKYNDELIILILNERDFKRRVQRGEDAGKVAKELGIKLDHPHLINSK